MKDTGERERDFPPVARRDLRAVRAQRDIMLGIVRGLDALMGTRAKFLRPGPPGALTLP